MPNAHDIVKSYFDALVNRDAETLVDMMLHVPHYLKIGTDADELVEGAQGINDYYLNHIASTEDFSIKFVNLDVHERDEIAWFYTLQDWNLKWQGTPELFRMRMTGVLEKIDETWKFVQIHASIGVPTS